MFSRWCEHASMVLSASFTVPGLESVEATRKSEWRWRAAWSLLFTVLMDLHRNETGYFHQLLGGPRILELKMRPAKLIFGVPDNFLVPKTVVLRADLDDLGTDWDSSGSSEEEVELVEKPQNDKSPVQKRPGNSREWKIKEVHERDSAQKLHKYVPGRQVKQIKSSQQAQGDELDQRRQETARCRGKRGGQCVRKAIARDAAKRPRPQKRVDHAGAEQLPNSYRHDHADLLSTTHGDPATTSARPGFNALVEDLSDDEDSLIIPATA